MSLKEKTDRPIDLYKDLYKDLYPEIFKTYTEYSSVFGKPKRRPYIPDITIKDIFDGMTEEQQNATFYMVAQAFKEKDNGYFSEEDDNMKRNIPNIKRVIFSGDCTIVLWDDGDKTIVRCTENDKFDPEKGLAMAISKKALGNKGNYYDIFKKHLCDAQPKEKNSPTIRGKRLLVSNVGLNSSLVDIEIVGEDKAVEDFFDFIDNLNANNE